jgi:hypothetical protein
MNVLSAAVQQRAFLRKSGTRFSVRKYGNAKMLERFLFPVSVKPF